MKTLTFKQKLSTFFKENSIDVKFKTKGAIQRYNGFTSDYKFVVQSGDKLFFELCDYLVQNNKCDYNKGFYGDYRASFTKDGELVYIHINPMNKSYIAVF